MGALQVNGPVDQKLARTQVGGHIGLDGVSQHVLLQLGGANDVVSRKCKFPSLCLIAHGEVEKKTGSDTCAVGVEELVLDAQHPAVGREDVNVETVFPIVGAA